MSSAIKAPPLLINAAYIGAIGLALLLAPGFMLDIFEERGTPDYLVRILGVLELALTAILVHCLLVGERRLLVNFGLIQAATGVGYALCILFGQASSNLLVIVEANIVLGLWTCLAAAGMTTLPLNGLADIRPTTPNKIPEVVSLTFLGLKAGLIIALPTQAAELLAIPMSVPVYVAYIFGMLTLVFVAIGLFALRANNGWLIRRLGWIQFACGPAIIAIALLHDLPGLYWLLAGANSLLGLWVARATLPVAVLKAWGR